MTTAFDQRVKQLVEEIMIEKLENTVAAKLSKHYPQEFTMDQIKDIIAAGIVYE